MSQGTHPIIAEGIDCNPLAPHTVLFSHSSHSSPVLVALVSSLPLSRRCPRLGIKLSRGADSRGECIVPHAVESPRFLVAPSPSTNKAATCVIVKAPKAKQVTSGGKLAGSSEWFPPLRASALDLLFLFFLSSFLFFSPPTLQQL